MARKNPFRALRGNADGATLVEFGFVAPVFCLLLVGAIDVGHSLYMKAVLQGVVQKAARDSALESGAEAAKQTTIDDKVRTAVRRLDKHAGVSISRRYYRTFEKASAALAEAYTDTDLNGVCDHGEPYQDANNNSVWDGDGGDNGQGAARDTVVYTVDVSYPRIVPLQKFLPQYSDTVNLRARTTLANQPYGEQNSYAAPTVRNCNP